MTYYDNTDSDPLLSGSVIESVNAWDQGIEGNEVQFKETVHEYVKLIRFRYLFILVCAIVIVFVSGYSLSLGAYNISFTETYYYFWNALIGTNFTVQEDITKASIIWDLRMPRVATAVFGGAALAVAGVAMQSVLKNPLADSYTTGVSSGAGFGATIVMFSGLAMTSYIPVVISAFIFAMIPTLAIIAISKMASASPTTMIMAGIGVMYIFSASTTVLMLWADPQSMADIYAWQVGSLANGGVNTQTVPIVMVCSIAGLIALWIMAGKINVLATGDESSKALGIDADKLRIIILLITGLLAASIVSFVGIVGFVGLVTPHIVRMFIGADNKYLIPASAIFGGMVMLCADQIGRVFLTTPLPVGVVMAFIGGPVFLWLILRRHKEVW
ncbi:MAG: iron ABC transporter permease [archaeon]|nr:iron ABC transporter permease [archaeon]